MASVGVAPTSGLRESGTVAVDRLLEQMNDMKIRDDENVSGVPKIRSNYNPATWMLEVTSTSAEAELGVDFAQIYKESALYEKNKRSCEAVEYPTSWIERSAFPNPVLTKWLGTIQILPMETELVLLEESIQPHAYLAYSCSIFALWCSVLEPGKENR